ncbi:hypothetical protein ACFROC_11590 [Nocardia tengchongensis]|uniref:hypothetical protein n=1 Tax=Nocardia tengchongensis TaxID=2055889 RepID=UPI0036A7A75E
MSFVGFAAPVGAIVAATIAGWVAIRNSRKPAHDRVESLVKALKDWPDEIEGRETAERSLALALAEIRVREGDTFLLAPLSETAIEAELRFELLSRGSRDERFIRIVALMLAYLGLAMAVIFISTPFPPRDSDVPVWGWVLLGGSFPTAVGLIVRESRIRARSRNLVGGWRARLDLLQRTTINGDTRPPEPDVQSD